METNIDCMKYRKSTHLASVDVEMIIAEKGECILTIEKAFYNKGVDVNGKSTDAYFIKFAEPNVKEMIVNSINRKAIAQIVKELKNCTAVESRNIGNWSGLKIKLVVDNNVKFAKQIVQGIRVEKSEPQAPKKTLQDALIAFNSVSSRDTFVACMKDYSEFMQVKEVIAHCQKLAILYPKPKHTPK